MCIRQHSGDVSTHTPLTKPYYTILYNCIAPLDDPSVIFLGRAHFWNSFRAAEAQAIWATAYIEGSVKLPPRVEAERAVAMTNAMSKLRYPTQGRLGNGMFFELVCYTDMLLKEVGLKRHRKEGWADWAEPCLASDFKGVVEEYRALYGPFDD